jgi:vacuolar-type H+-ATPase subunit H
MPRGKTKGFVALPRKYHGCWRKIQDSVYFLMNAFGSNVWRGIVACRKLPVVSATGSKAEPEHHRLAMKGVIRMVKGRVSREGPGEGLELLKELAELERSLAERIEQARRSAEDKIKGAEEEGLRILAEAEAEIRQIADTSRARIVKNEGKTAEEARARAEAEAESIRRRAAPNIDRAVDYILSEVLP